MPGPEQRNLAPFSEMSTSESQKVRDLEAQVQTILNEQRQQADLLHRMESMLALLSNPPTPMPTTPAPPAPPQPQTVLPPEPQPQRDLPPHFVFRGVKPATPQSYDGDRRKAKSFLTSCKTYMKLAAHEFPDVETMVTWTLSYMSRNRASTWAQRTMEDNTQNGFRYHDWSEFEEDFKTHFYPLNQEDTATNTLEGTSYFQGKRSVDDYLDSFLDLISDSGHKDPKTIVIKFRRGLNPEVSTAVATMVSGRPSDTDPQAWYDAAVRVEQVVRANKTFQAVNTYQRTPRFQPTPSTLPNPPVQRYAHSNPSPGNPIPMDIDAARRSRNLPVVCPRCGKTGHKGKDCRSSFDVRRLDTEEALAMRERLDVQIRLLEAQQLLDTFDPPESSQTKEPLGAIPEDDDGDDDEDEDFQQDNE